MLLQAPGRCLGAGTRSQPVPARRCVAASAKRNKPQQKRQRKPKEQRSRIVLDDGADEDSDWDEGEIIDVPQGLTSGIPRAPPTAVKVEKPPRPEDLYAVFPKDPLVAKMEGPSSSRSSGRGGGGGGFGASSSSGAGGAAAEPAAPAWNPRTGFMRTRAQVEAEQQRAAAAGGSPAGGGAGPGGGAAAAGRGAVASSSPAASGAAAARSSSSSGAGGSAAAASGAATSSAAAPLAAVAREQVLRSAGGTAAGLLVVAAILRLFADETAAELLGTDPAAVQRLLALPPGLASAADGGVMLAAAGGVTGARLALLRLWPALREATDASNRQVLAPLSWGDVFLVSLLAGVPEEVLFRAALIPATLPDWRGAALAAAVFGALHVTGGRNAAFAVWAAAVGGAYGAAFLYTGNIWVAAGAHTLANFASAAAWRAQNSSSGGGGGGGGGDASKQ